MQDVVHGGVAVVALLTLLAAAAMETKLVHFNVSVGMCEDGREQNLGGAQLQS